jgi:hypothetical protein
LGFKSFYWKFQLAVSFRTHFNLQNKALIPSSFLPNLIPRSITGSENFFREREIERDYDAFGFYHFAKGTQENRENTKKNSSVEREKIKMKFKIYLMLPKHNKKTENETVREWGRHWNNDDEIPGKMYIDWSGGKKRKGGEEIRRRIVAFHSRQAHRKTMAMRFRNGQENCNASRLLRRFKNGIGRKKSQQRFEVKCHF